MQFREGENKIPAMKHLRCDSRLFCRRGWCMAARVGGMLEKRFGIGLRKGNR